MTINLKEVDESKMDDTSIFDKKMEKVMSPIMESEVDHDEDPKKQEKSCVSFDRVSADNVVSGEKLKKVQLKTLETLKNYLSSTYGPMGSYTQIITGSSQDNTSAKYSKDGATVMKKILFDRPIEMAIRTEMEEVCRYTENTVGDGTTSATILSYFIFKAILEIERKYPAEMPRSIIDKFNKIVSLIQNKISSHGRPVTIDDIYDICMISTNGNREVSEIIEKIYKDYDMNVDISVSISNDKDNKLKEYDGVTFDEGYSDMAYVNNTATGTADIQNAEVYYFEDPADDAYMINIFERIITDNIFKPISNHQLAIPTVILCPRLSRDSMSILNKLVENLYNMDKQGMAASQKPQILVITNYLGAGEGVAYDISKLCGCKGIRKYINPDNLKADQESGLAPTEDNLRDFAGGADLVSASSSMTKFINPKAMVENPKVYDGIIKFLENSIRTAEERMEDKLSIGRLKERLKRLKMNNVEYLIGGITISDRDSLKDLVIDAVKNCRSAVKYGVGYAANFEGLRAAFDICSSPIGLGKVGTDIVKGIFQAYYEATKILYASCVGSEKAYGYIHDSLFLGKPINLSTVSIDDNPFDGKCNVLTSIKTDIEILEAVKKIVGLMATSNQCILQSTQINTYC